MRRTRRTSRNSPRQRAPQKARQRSQRSPERWAIFALLAWALLLAAIVAVDAPFEWRPLMLGIVVVSAVLSLLLLARTRRPGACAAILCGAAGVTAGMAFGPGHLAWGGASWRVAAGLILLVAGVVLAFAGIRELTTGLKRGWSLLVGLAAVLLVVITAWVLTPAVLATNPPHVPAGETLPGDHGLTAREVQFMTSDGVELFAWYVPPSNGAAVVLRHGAGSTASDSLAHAAVLARHGYGVLVTDARGHGRSGGKGMEFGWYGDEDIAAAVSFLLGQTDVNPERIAVLGLSMGGEEAIGAAAAETRIAAVVAEGALARTAEDKAWLPDVYGRRGQVQLGLERIQYGFADMLTPASPPVSLADAAGEASPTPVLLITAGNVADEGHAAAHIQRQSPASVTVWNVPWAGHTQGLSVAPAEWERTVVDFLDAALR